MSVVVSAAILAYLSLATKLFSDDKTLLVYELNASNVRTIAAEFEAELLKITDKVKLLTQGFQNQRWIRSVFSSEPEIISFELYSPNTKGDQWKKLISHRNSDYLKLYQLKSNSIEQIRSRVPIPFEKILKKSVYITNSTLEGGAPILSVGLTIKTKASFQSKVQTKVAFLDIRADHILKRISETGIAKIYIVNGDGVVIAHPDPLIMGKRLNLSHIPIVQSALESKKGLQIQRFEFNQQKWIGAHLPLDFGDLHVISQINEDEVFKAARQLINKSILLALLIITITLLFTTRLAKSFTEPLYRLLGATQNIQNAKFGDSVTINTNDEIGELTGAFNKMSKNLLIQRKQIQAHQDDLEKKVKERTAALETQKKKASEAQEALLRTTRLASLGEMAGMAAHEVLNPLNNISIRIQRIQNDFFSAEENDAGLLNEIIQGWKDSFKKGGWEGLQDELSRSVDQETGTKTTGNRPLIEEDFENLQGIAGDLNSRLKEKREDYQFIRGEISRIAKMVNNMRSIARVGGDRKLINIHMPLENTLAAMGEFLDKNEIQLKTNFNKLDVKSFSIVADQDELIQIFSNIIRNATQAMEENPNDKKMLEISTKLNKEESNPRIEIRIADQGSGIDKDHLSKIFEPDFTTKTFDKGTGLGLSITRRLIRAFSGDIVVEKTDIGKGTTFLIWFPTSSSK